MTIKQQRSRVTVSIAAALLIVSNLSQALPGQTLARPGWVGSGLTAQTWFKRAIFYEIDTRTFSGSNADGVGDLKGITQRLGYIQSLGVDAILLKPLTGSQTTGPSAAIDPTLGTLDDFDDLTLQASRLKIRVLVELATPDAALARFWLTRGVAGFYLPGDLSANAGAIQGIRKLLSTYVGQRILITDADPSTATSNRASANELVLDRVVVKAALGSAVVTDLRAALNHSQELLRGGNPIFAIAALTEPGLARASLAAVLLNRSAALIVAGQELGLSSEGEKAAPMPWGQPPTVAVEEAPEPAKPTAPVATAPDRYTPFVPYVRPAAPKKELPPDPATVAGQDKIPGSLLNFYRQLSLLHHGGTAIHDGEEISLDHDGQNALIWIRRPASPSLVNSPVVVACNISDKPIVLSLRADLTRLKLRGNFLRTVLRSDDAMGGASIDPLTLPAYGVYVGELRR